MSLYLTFDIGTTGLKTALTSGEGRMLAVHTVEYTPNAPSADRAEMSPQTYWDAAVAGTRAVFTSSGASPSGLAAIGFSSQGQTFIPVDSAGRPLHDAIVWVDNRAQEIADSWEADWLSRDEFRRITGYPWLCAQLTVFKIAWLARHEPEAHRAWKFLCLPDYLIYRLTGEVATDRVVALASGMYDMQTGGWATRLIGKAGISAEQLPVLLEPGTVVGRVTARSAEEFGIPEGVPVCVGAHDQVAASLGAGNVHPGIATETTGTALAVVATTEDPLDDTRFCIGRHVMADRYYALSFANTSAIVLKWFRDMCSAAEDYDAFLAGAQDVPPGCEGLTVVPHFAGTSTPTFNPHARGAFVGLTLGHTRSHLARAIMESCACILKECLEPLHDHELHISSIRSLGGAARSDLWLQIKADMLGIPVERPACPDAASLGAAMLAAAAIGQFETVEEASEAWYRPGRVFEPDTSRFDVYRQVYERYRTIYERLYGIQEE